VNIIVAPDSFKGSLTALQAADAIVQGIRHVLPEAEIVSFPLADGGEGTCEALVLASEGRFLPQEVVGPLGEPVKANLGILGDDVTGVVEMAQAAGLSLVPPEKRNPLLTTTFGVGQLMRAALDAGCTRIIVGLGGSATNDGGAGMAQALGARLLDAGGSDLPPGGAALLDLERVDLTGLDARLQQTTIYAATDVTNPLCGPQGASAIYGPQKGATPEMVAQLDKALARFAYVVERDLSIEVRDLAGAGAAGGLGAGVVAFCGAKFRSGASLVLEMLRFEQYLDTADLIFTGEGRLDRQIEFGKAISGVALLAEKYQVPVIALTGSLAIEPDALARRGISGVVPIIPGPMDEQEAMTRASELLQEAAERTMRLLLIGRQVGEGRLPADRLPGAEPP
jgi:glycerate kinase